jgi:hypothetical protein
MRTRLLLLAFAAISVWLAADAPAAHAFGGSAQNLQQKGNFVVTNNAGFGFTQQLTSPTDTTFTLRPALDYFVIDHLSLGGAVEFDVVAPQHDRSRTNFSIVPDVGYALGLTDTWSFWLIGSLPLSFPNPGNASVAVDVFAAFLVHPADHFFFGIGPTFTQVITANPSTTIGGRFIIGGFFDH